MSLGRLVHKYSQQLHLQYFPKTGTNSRVHQWKEYINKLWYGHVLEYIIQQLKKTKILIDRTWMNLKNMANGRSFT